MNLEKFEEVYKQLRDATCPEDFFGNIEGNDISKFNYICKQKEDYFDKITSKIGKKVLNRGNLSIRVSSSLSVLLTLKGWALEKLEKGLYGNYVKYRLKILFLVKRYQIHRRKYFYLLGYQENIKLSKINAYFFGPGYEHSDEIFIFEKGIPVNNGNIGEYGTHDAHTCFFIKG